MPAWLWPGSCRHFAFNWRQSDPEKVLGEAPDRAKAQKLIRLFDTLTD
jgi:hypothetical protein